MQQPLKSYICVVFFQNSFVFSWFLCFSLFINDTTCLFVNEVMSPVKMRCQYIVPFSDQRASWKVGRWANQNEGRQQPHPPKTNAFYNFQQVVWNFLMFFFLQLKLTKCSRRPRRCWLLVVGCWLLLLLLLLLLLCFVGVSWQGRQWVWYNQHEKCRVAGWWCHYTMGGEVLTSRKTWPNPP